MCVAYPGKVTEIIDKIAKVDFGGNLVDIRVDMVDVKINDYVLVHAGCAIEVMSEKKANEIMEVFKDLGEMI